MRTLALSLLLALSFRSHVAKSFPLLRASLSSMSGGSSSSSNVQQMFDALSVIPNVSRSVAEPENCPHVQACLKAMNAVTLEELGLRRENIERLRDSVCASIIQTPNFNIAVFLLPRGASLPLHDHPGMTVLSKVVHGEMQMRSFSPLLRNKDAAHSGASDDFVEVEVGPVETKRKEDVGFYLTPKRGNIHEFVAASGGVAVLDVLMPPYKEPERPCNYYQIEGEENLFASEARGVNSRLWLKRMRSDYEPKGLPYGVQYFGQRPKST